MRITSTTIIRYAINLLVLILNNKNESLKNKYNNKKKKRLE